MADWIRLTRRFTFETAHALAHYDGACRHIHGHSYKLEVTVLGQPTQVKQHPKNGMVMDFGDLKQLVQAQVLQDFDHALLLPQDSPAALVTALQVNGQKLVITAWQPTCENMLLHVKNQLQHRLPAGVRLHSLKLWETENAYGEWHAADNLSS